MTFRSVQTDPGLPQLQGWVGYHEVHLQRLLDKGVQEAGGQPQNKPSGKTNKMVEKLAGECLINSILNLSILCRRVPMFCKTISFVCWLSSPVGSSTLIRLLRLACNFSYMHAKQIHPPHCCHLIRTRSGKVSFSLYLKCVSSSSTSLFRVALWEELCLTLVWTV